MIFRGPSGSFDVRISGYSIQELEQLTDEIKHIITYLTSRSIYSYSIFSPSMEILSGLQREISVIEKEIEDRKSRNDDDLMILRGTSLFPYGIKTQIIESQKTEKPTSTKVQKLEERVDSLEKKLTRVDKKTDDSMTEFHQIMEKKMPIVDEVYQELKSTESVVENENDESE